MAKRKHLKLIGDKQLEEVSKVKFNYGFSSPNEEEDPNPDPNYFLMAVSLRSSVEVYTAEREIKYSQRSTDIKIPFDIDYIQINFVSQFVISEYYNDYYQKFGLEGVAFTNFGKSGLFAVVKRELFEGFLKSVNSFIEFGLSQNSKAKYSQYITYVNSFKLLTSRDIIHFEVEEIGRVIYLSVVELPLDFELQQSLIKAVFDYLDSKDILYEKDGNRIELIDADYDTIKVIVENFDIIQSVTCSLSSVIGPSNFNVPSRGYGFTISNADEALPIIGIIDTGISMSSPLASIVIQDRSFSINGDPLIDVAGRGRNGHGTGVAGLAALGRANHLNKFQTSVAADAKLLSIKISDSDSGYISETHLIQMLYEAKAKYPEMKLFVLTMCYSKFKSTNESFSLYTFELDKFAHRTDSLIFICTANNGNCINENTDYDLEYFNAPHTNLCTPADSLNNVTVGAAAGNLNDGAFLGISSGKEYPTLYTRKGHIDLKAIFPGTKTNKNYFKPDVIECGGDIGFYNANTLDWTNDPAMLVLSARPEIGFVHETGTSLSAPLVANLAAKIIKEYPSIHIQTVKALIINGASLNNIQFSKSVMHLQNLTSGHGFVDAERCLYSSENSPTLILEDTIRDDEMKIYPVYFPDYLVQEALGKNKSILKFTATLCFSFEPIQNNQLSYNPIHMAFTFFKNHNAEQIVSKNNAANSKLRSTLSWSQSGRFQKKPIPYSNSQKLSFTIDLAHLISENQTLKLAIQSRLTTQVIGGILDSYPTEFLFSLVITIEENTKIKTGKLYDEIIAVNNLEVIQSADLEGIIEI